LGTTAIGHNIAVPHARSDVLADIRMAIGMSKQGVDFQALDGKPVKAIFLIVAPHSKADEYIEVMKAVSQLVQTEDFRNFLFQSRNAGDIIELLDEMSS
jgi:PTS system nitrogen regulatory IIA component